MKRNSAILVMTIFATIHLNAQISNETEAMIDEVFSELSVQNEPGVAAGIIKDGQVVYLKGFGSANMESNTPITPQTKFQLGEMSKQFTSLAILVLEQAGKISMEDDVREFIPELPAWNYTLRIGHLLNHSSGLHNINQVNYMVNGTAEVLSQDHALNLINAQKKLSFEPGTDFSHHESITESILMVEIVERVSEQPFSEFVETRIFNPLGMRNSIIRGDSKTILTNTAVPYLKEEDAFKRFDVSSSLVGAINAYSSAEDLAIWYLNFTHPTGDLGHLVQRLDTPVQLSSGKKFIYYWGEMAIGREFKHPERGISKIWNYGMQGGYGSIIFRFPEQKLTSFVLGNSEDYNGSLGMNAVHPLIKDHYLMPEVIDYTKLKTKTLSKEKLKIFEGDYWYRKAGYASKLFVENDTLRSRWIFTERLQRLLPLTDSTFQALGSNEDIRLFDFKREDAGMKLYFHYNNSAADVMERYDPVVPNEQTLASYSGTYYNEEYASVFSFYIEKGQLLASNLDHEPIAFKPVMKDVFTSTRMFITALEFLRGDADEIIGFTVDTDGIHNLVFLKVPAEIEK